MINNKYNINQKVTVIALELEGFVKAMEVTQYGLTYLVRYLSDNRPEECWLYEEEIVA